MIKQYFQQATYELKAHPLLSAISIIGTALAICLIMVLVVMQQIQVAPFYPEVNRNRTLHVKYIKNRFIDSEYSSSGTVGLRVVRECFLPLTIPETVAIYSLQDDILVSVPGSAAISVDCKQTDDQFWKVFEFSFTEGKPYDKATFGAGIPVAVITEQVARELFGSTQVVGQQIWLNYAEYTISGVVKNVSMLASTAYAQMWIPYTSTDLSTNEGAGQLDGSLRVVILARDRKDFPAIRQEAEQLRLRFNESLGYREILYMDQPDDQYVYSHRRFSNEAPDIDHIRQRQLIIFLILLIIPAINLSSMIQSRLRQRIEEIGIRRSFGCTRFQILWQVLMENLVLTAIAALLGTIVCIMVSYFWGNKIFATATWGMAPEVEFDMLMQPLTFLYALFFCLVLNILSTGIPAWRACKMSITAALISK